MLGFANELLPLAYEYVWGVIMLSTTDSRYNVFSKS